MSMELKKYNIVDALEAIIDYRGRTPNKSETGIPTLSAKSVKMGYIDYDQCYYISPKEYESFMVRGFPQKGDVLVTTEAPLGVVAQLDRDDVAIAQRLLTLRGKKGVLDNAFLFYYLQSSAGQQRLIARQSGSTVMGIRQEEFRKIEIEIPSFQIQQQIASVLSNLDRKIALNRAINRNLEALAKQLYDYWFVQFDFPDENGRPYKSSGGKMVWNEVLKREVPEGWEAKTLFESTNVQYGFPFSTESFTEEITDVPVVRIRDILDGTVSAYSYEDTDEKYHLQEGDVLVGMDGNFHMNYWHNNNAYLNQRCVRIRPYCDSPISSIQVLHAIKPYIKAKEQNAKGSTVGHLSDKDMKGLFLLEPKVSQLFNPRKTFDPILKQIIKNKQEIAALTRQCDELLPLLMNGQVTIG